MSENSENKIPFNAYAEKVVAENLLQAHSRIIENGSVDDITKLSSYILNITESMEFEVVDPDSLPNVTEIFYDDASCPHSAPGFLMRSLGSFGTAAGNKGSPQMP